MYKLSEDYEEMKEMFHDFAEGEVKPLAQKVDEEHMFPEETVAKMQELGFFGIPFDEEFGGQGADTLTYVLAVEEISKYCASTGVVLSAHTSLCADCLNKFANDEQKKKYLTPLASGEKLGAFGLTEPNAGTDASGQQTTAKLDGDEYVLNGTKIFIPKENLLGEEGKGFKIAMATLDGGRIGIAAQALGIAEGALEKAIQYSKEREQFGRPLAKFQNTQFKLAEMAIEVEAARHLVYKAASLKDAGENYSVAAAMAKLKASRTASFVADRAVQILGGYGYIKEYDVERMMRDAKITEIYEGTSEVMLMVVSGALLR